MESCNTRFGGVCIAGNSAIASGGGLASSGAAAHVNIAGTSFVSNSALPRGAGGAMNLNDISAVAFGGGVSIRNCAAFVGGGIWWRYMGDNVTDVCPSCVFAGGNTSKSRARRARCRPRQKHLM